jgi:Holliday junction resolvase RusA-like endonuclease
LSAWVRYDITPVPKPRQTQRDKWAKRPAVLRYRAFADEVRLRKVKLPEHAHVLFVLPMPASWNQTQRGGHRGAAHLQKPDVDNLQKGLLDALYEDDSGVWDIRATKIWGDKGAIWVREIKPPEFPS